MIPGLHDLLSRLTYDVGFHNPGGLAILFIVGVFTDIGVPLLFGLEVFLLFASYYIGPLSLQVALIVLMLLLGRSAGGSILYWLSYIIGEPFLKWLEKHFSWLLRGTRNLRNRIDRRTILVVTLVRLTPGFLQIPSVVTGSLHIKYTKFILGVIFSSLIYDVIIVLFGYIGHVFLQNARRELEAIFIIGFVLLIVAFWTLF